jgi:type IV secretion system protein VirB6
MNQWHFFAYLYTTFDQTFLQALQQMITNAVNYIRVPLTSAVTLYIAGTAAIELYAPGGDPMFFLLRKIIRAVIVVLAVAVANYSNLFGQFLLTTLPNEITSAIAGGPANGTLAPDAFDKMLGGVWASGNEVYKNISGWSAKAFGLVIVDVFYIFFSSIAIAGGFIIFMAQHILLGLCVAVGPLLLPLLLWQRTVRFFDGWIGTLLALILTQVLIVALLSILVKVNTLILQQIAALNGTAGINANDELSQLHYLVDGVVLTASIGFFAGVVPFIARSIAGSVAAEVAPITRMAHNAVSAGLGATGRVAAGVTGAVGNVASSAAAGMRSLKPTGKAP